MISSPEEKLLYSEIQKKLFYIIPEKWECIYLYASVIDVPNQKSVGEMYFYYLPKGIIKKKYVNGYEIPSIFNIDEEQYSKLITDVYNLVKLLHEKFVGTGKKKWSSITITIRDSQFLVEFDYEDLTKSEFDSYQRHVIWRSTYLKEDTNNLSRKDKKILDWYAQYLNVHDVPKKDFVVEPMYKLPVKNIVEYEKTLTVDEAMSRTDNNTPKPKKKIGLFSKKKKEETNEDDEITYNNQILNYKK